MGEVESPQLAVTEQFFAVHRLADEPVAGVWHKDGSRWVFLRLQGEPYYWVVRVEQQPNGQLRATWGFHSPHANVYAAVYSQRLSVAEISAVLGISPTDQRSKGQLLPGGRRAYQEHRWYYHPDVPDCLDFETKLNRLLQQLPAEKVQSLPGDCSVGINVAYYEYQDGPGGWHLDAETLSKLAALGADLDVDLYVSGPPLPE